MVVVRQKVVCDFLNKPVGESGSLEHPQVMQPEDVSEQFERVEASILKAANSDASPINLDFFIKAFSKTDFLIIKLA